MIIVERILFFSSIIFIISNFFKYFKISNEVLFFKTYAIFFDSEKPALFDIIGKHFLLLASIAIRPSGSSQTEFPIAISDFSK